MMALGPIAADNDTILVALQKYSPSGSHGFDTSNTTTGGYIYLSVSLDRRHPQNSTLVSPSAFWGAVVAHAAEWQEVFAPRLHGF